MTQLHLKTKNIDTDVVLRKGRYADGSTAIVAQDAITGEQEAKVTVNMVAYGQKPRNDNHVFIKDYAENEGMFTALHKAGVISAPLKTLDAGHATDGVFECEVFDLDAIEEL
jgi:hypothetical protein